MANECWVDSSRACGLVRSVMSAAPRGMVRRVSVLVACLGVGLSVSADDFSDYFLTLPNGQRLELKLPGQVQLAQPESERGTVVVYSPEQAAQIATVLATEGLADLVPRTITGLGWQSAPDTPSTTGEFLLCIRIARPWKTGFTKPEIAIPASLKLSLPGKPRYATHADGRRLLLFSVPQAERVFDELRRAGLNIPEAAIAIAGLLAPHVATTAIGVQPLRPDCNACLSGTTCQIGTSRECCSSTAGPPCISCHLCATDVVVTTSISE